MAENGQFVTVHYTGTLSDGKVFDSTEGNEPFEFEIGCSQVIPAFENEIKAMAVNEEKSFFIKSADAYGEYRDDLIQKVPLQDVAQYLKPEKNMVIQVMMADGQHAPARISDVTETEVSLDFNHPLAGEDLTFKLKLTGITDEPTQEQECGCGDEECGGGSCSDGGGCGCGCGN